MWRALLTAFLCCTAQAQECIPNPTTIMTISDGWGTAYGFRCPNEAGFIVTVLHDYRAGNPNAQIGAVLSAPDQIAAAKSLMAASAKAPTGAYVAPYNDLTARMQALMKKSAPRQVWRVQPNPLSTSVPATRPMFSAADPSKTVAERAYVGDLCTCAAPVIKGTQKLCPLRQLGDLPPTTNLTACVPG